MRALGVLFAAALSACVSTKIYELDARHFGAAPPLPVSFEAQLYQAARFTEIAYGNRIDDAWDKRTNAAQEFSAEGYNVLYYHPTYSTFIRDPNLFVLGRTGAHEIMILFTGTEIGHNWYDIIQDLRTRTTADDEEDGSYYVPRGHAGYRDGVRNLIREDFLPDRLNANMEDVGNTLTYENCDADSRSVLIAFICRHRIYNESEARANRPIRVILVGHSLGAGLAQVAMPMFHGLVWNDGTVVRRSTWPFTVERMYAFAPPFAVYSHDHDTCRRVQPNNPIDIIEHFGLDDDSIMVLREGDMVSTIWSPFADDVHCVPGEHFGRYFRIDRDGLGMNEITDQPWWLNRPHTAANYQEAVRRYHNSAHPNDPIPPEASRTLLPSIDNANSR